MRACGVAMAVVVALGGAGLTGCVNIADAVSTRMSDPPEWFEAARREMRGEGYPDIRDVPALIDPPTDQARWQSDADALKDQADAIEADPKSAPPVAATADELRARAAQLRALTEAGGGPR
ncbi:hypothetical protein GC169_05780 [bacterium]|nr:hypothetical protein [bacterium]